ncbi:unnamed protein product [Prorocentrum cordatum]|uniref:Glycerophosphocholine acyltransferase 1 n=1 Tax=Prorocentrum cordatum TaxID=2364126 RepID=A0ABN9U680_9DINO|nr:unnamed protein product [Polarella glacialis]
MLTSTPLGASSLQSQEESRSVMPRAHGLGRVRCRQSSPAMPPRPAPGASWPLPSCGMLRLRQESWEKHFEAWDVLWCQLQILTLPVYLLLYLWHSWPWNPIHLVGRLWKCALYTTIVVVQAFMAWYCIVSRGGCCGGVGYFLWCISLVISGACAFAGPGEDTEGYGYFAYLAQLIPVLYMCYACWQLKRATGFSVRQCCNAMTGRRSPCRLAAGARALRLSG